MLLRITQVPLLQWVLAGHLLTLGVLTCLADPGEGPPEGLYRRRVNQVGLEEVYLRVGQVWVLEVRAPGEGKQQNRLLYRQISDGHKLTTAVYGLHGNIIYCDIEKDGEEIQQFIKLFTEKTSSSDKRCESSRICMLNEKEFIQDFGMCQPFNVTDIESTCHSMGPTSSDDSSVNSNLSSDDVDGNTGTSFHFLAPGTNYCGAGNRGGGLGHFAAADRCCRDHDSCPYSIPAFTRLYRLFNPRPYTVSWHPCDLRFQACLKKANKTSADVIGTTYFTLLGPPSFTLPDVPPNKETKARYSKEKIEY